MLYLQYTTRSNNSHVTVARGNLGFATLMSEKSKSRQPGTPHLLNPLLTWQQLPSKNWFEGSGFGKAVAAVAVYSGFRGNLMSEHFSAQSAGVVHLP